MSWEGTWTESIFQPKEPGNIDERSVTGKKDSCYRRWLKVEESRRPPLKESRVGPWKQAI